MLFKETSLDPSVAVSPEKHLFSTWLCKPGKYYTALPKSFYTDVFRPKVPTNATQIFELSCALKYLPKEMLFASIRSALSDKQLSSKLEVFALCVNHSSFIQGNDTTSILRFRRSTYNFPARCSENDFQC